MRTRTPLSEFSGVEPGYCIFGAETLLTRIQELENQIEGAKRNDDIEYVHKLRVASRRLRTTIAIFAECFAAKRIKRWKKTIRNLTASSGTARDTDVLIEFLEDYSAQVDPKAARGLKSLIATVMARRAVMQSDVITVLDSLQTSGTLADISEKCSAITNIGKRNSPIIKTLFTYGKAHDHIQRRVDELLALEPFVHDRSAITQHHELRIAAKRLRYTMEVFSTIYRSGLSNQIALMKQFQDILGEMHDYYVWCQDLTAHRLDVSTDTRYGMKTLLSHLRKRRKTRYRNFVSLWDHTVTKDTLTSIARETDTGPSSDIVHEVLNSQTRVAVISDIHGNLHALKAVVEDAERTGLHVFLNAGDAVGFGIYPSEVVQALRSPMFLSVMGNVDFEILETLRRSSHKSNEELLTLKALSPSDVAYLQSLPRELRLQIQGRRVLVTHGSPDSIDEHIYPDSSKEQLKEIAAEASADIIITGHTHRQMNRIVDGVTFLNPGSVGRPVDGDAKAKYAVLSLNPLTVAFRKVNYRIETVADEMRKKSLPENHVQVLLRAIDLASVKRQEKALIRKRLWKSRSTITRVRAIAKTFLIDEGHAEQDRKLALRIFDGTRRSHSLGAHERYWLECAAILHDIGLSKGKKGHHKSSLRLIMNDPSFPFTQRERLIIGSIARYHRKAVLDRKHANLRPLSQTESETVAVLSSILRLADALDYSHNSVVKKVNVKFSPNSTILECVSSGPHNLENQSVARKKELFEKVFKNSLTLVWKSRQPHRNRD
jgi:putative phosphoesterase